MIFCFWCRKGRDFHGIIVKFALTKFYLMKFKATLLGVILVSAPITACGNGGDQGAYIICVDSLPGNQARDMALRLGPAESARALVDWLVTADRADRVYASELARELSSIFSCDTSGREMEMFSTAIEAAKDSLPPSSQAKILTVAAAPSRLGYMLRGDSAASELVPLIEKEYATDSVALSQFRNSYNK